jgi:3-oxoacyl-[acyl-carrier-protein] synthase II
VYEKGAKFASPAVFPNLLPSSPVAHASIYHRLRGPVWANADLGVTGESALVTAVELIRAGEADRMVAGGVEPTSLITESVLEPLYGSNEVNSNAPRSEGAAVLLLESADSLAGRTPIAEVAWTLSRRGPLSTLDALPGPASLGRAAVFGALIDAAVVELLAEAGWGEVPRYNASPRAGSHECAGAFAAAAAVSKIALGELDSALILGIASDRAYGMLLRPCAAPSEGGA